MKTIYLALILVIMGLSAHGQDASTSENKNLQEIAHFPRKKKVLFNIKGFVGDETGIEVLSVVHKNTFSVRWSYYNLLRKNQYDTGIWEGGDLVTFSKAFDISICYYRKLLSRPFIINAGLGYLVRLSQDYYRRIFITKYDLAFFKVVSMNWELAYSFSPRVSGFVDIVLVPRLRGLFDLASPYKKSIFVSKYVQGMAQVGVKYNFHN